jgi:Cu/Ag efflux protein CusF
MRIRLIVACTVLTLITACSGQVGPTPASSPAPSGPAAAVETISYPGVGTVKSINLKQPAIEIDHEDIVGLMPAMQMEFPVTDAALLNGIAVNDRIEFTIENAAGEMRVTAIKKK